VTITEAQEALAAGDFARALDALAGADGATSAAGLELRAQASYGHGAYEDAVAAWEQLHALHRAAGERVPAARAAVMTAMFLLIDAGMLSTVRGWVRRAQRSLEGADESPVHALVAAVLAYERFFSGDLDEAGRMAAEAVRMGEELDVMAAVSLNDRALTRHFQSLNGRAG